MKDHTKALPQYLLPHHRISRLTYRLTRVQAPRFKNALIRWFIKTYNVDMSLAVQPDPTAYATFNEFFTRTLRPEVRPIVGGPNEIACPVDGAVAQLGAIRNDTIFQAKGHDYSLTELLGGNVTTAAAFRNGQFATLYLSPRDYHRIHMPLDGALKEMIYVPGRLFAVNNFTVRVIPRVFARNERVIALFETPIGPMAMALVGAINVGCIETVWAGVVTPPTRPRITTWRYGENPDSSIALARGAEMGRFNMGSTVILLFGPDVMAWSEELGAGAAIRMGQLLGKTTKTRGVV